MFGGHIWELAIILGLALVVFGPKRLPEIGGALGKGIREFKQGTAELSNIDTPAPRTTPAPAAVPVAVAAPAVDSTAHETEAHAPYSSAG